MFEKSSFEKENQEGKLKKFLELISENLKKEGMPVDLDCRIDIDFFDNIYSLTEIENDKKEIEKLKEKFQTEEKEELETKKWKKNPERALEMEEEKKEKLGEKLEMLKTAIFSKNLGKDFLVVRTSLYDDIKNRVDNLILNKETSEPICAFDEVADTMDTRYRQKSEKVLERNKKEGGGKLKYGIKIEKDGKLTLGKIENIPLFYLVLPPRHIEEGEKQLLFSFEQKSDYEEKLFNYFLSSLFHQINYLKLEKKLNLDLKKRVESFEKNIGEFFSQKVVF